MKALAVVILSLSLALAAAPAPAAPGTLSLAGRVEVVGSKVTLLDLASRPESLAPGLKERLAATVVGVAPPLGRRTRITGTRLRALMKRADLPDDLTVLIPATVDVARAQQKVSGERLMELFEDALRARLERRGMEADIHGQRALRGLRLPAGRLETRVTLSRALYGRVRGSIDVMVDGVRRARVQAAATVDVYADVVTAARPLGRGVILTRDDLRVERVRLVRSRGPAARDPEQVVGLRTRNVVDMGSPIELNRLERAPLIRRGDVVTMVCRSGGLRVTAKGKAEQIGYRGGRIRLVNLASKRKVYGKVLDSGSVLVEF
jgi:flagella basal body P-ring formation protein FlgA